ncbi:hypothetical protein CYL18_14610 [Pradoshia eiseniae]|uniref:Uncharacterized protein n=1 Tax=Pradoshia eiseniae TaxID=2064768 RepID=A0A2S7MXB4_9BACI|nr:hypothetical protein [Pradoshia eiseniae]PQD94441.1 hypothetical protein CYL18_14610 [Pradoshia eiseniae]
MDAVAKVKLVFYALLMVVINISAVYYAFVYEGGSWIFADKGQYSFGERATAADNKVPVTLHITSKDNKPVENLKVSLKSMSNGKASLPQKTNEKGIVQWTVSQGVYTVVIYLNDQVIKEKNVAINQKKKVTIQLNLDI